MIFVRHGRIFAMVSPNRLRRLQETFGRHESTGMAKTNHNKDDKEEKTKEESPVSEVVPADADSQEVVQIDRDTEEQSSVRHRNFLPVIQKNNPQLHIGISYQLTERQIQEE